MQKYDIIGDIHGCYKELCRLLKKLGYRAHEGVYSHPSRKAIFLGDYIDRGPENRKTLRLVCAMEKSGAAICLMGNHEFNALCYHTRLKGTAHHLRRHNKKHVKQHAMTVAEFKGYKKEWQAGLKWMRSLPMWLDLPGLRVVHACWDAGQMALIEKHKDAGPLTYEFLAKASDKKDGSKLYYAIDEVLKGKEVRLPEEYCFSDKDGHERRKIRIAWYRKAKVETYFSYCFPHNDAIPDKLIPKTSLAKSGFYPPGAKPVFFGHYWLKGVPGRLASNVACLDYSVAKSGRLCAYRWDGEAAIDDRKFVWVEVP